MGGWAWFGPLILWAISDHCLCHTYITSVIHGTSNSNVRTGHDLSFAEVRLTSGSSAGPAEARVSVLTLALSCHSSGDSSFILSIHVPRPHNSQEVRDAAIVASGSVPISRNELVQGCGDLLGQPVIRWVLFVSFSWKIIVFFIHPVYFCLGVKILKITNKTF